MWKIAVSLDLHKLELAVLRRDVGVTRSRLGRRLFLLVFVIFSVCPQNISREPSFSAFSVSQKVSSTTARSSPESRVRTFDTQSMSEKGESTRPPPGGAMSNSNSAKDVTSSPQTEGKQDIYPPF